MRGKAEGRYSPRRGGSSGGDDESNRWLGTYGDAITLLMAFFVMLYALSEVDVEKFQAFVEGLRVPFGNEQVTTSLLPDAGRVVGEDAPPLPTEAPEDPAEQPDPAVDTEQLDAVQTDLQSALEDAGLEDIATFRLDHRGLVLSIGADDVLFATGSTVVSPLGRRIVASVSGVLARIPNDIVIEGHTDNVPLDRGGYTNWNLSTDRAVAVLALLEGRRGLDPSRLGAAGYGEQRPVTSNTTDSGRSRNRRVDFLIVGESRG
jgi:chemotaxis protein MotB